MTHASLEEMNFAMPTSDGTDVYVRVWQPEVRVGTKAVVQVAHGLMEHSGRYRRLAEALTQAGYVVYANDHRGHGRTAPTVDEVGLVGNDALHGMVRDMHALTRHVKTEHPDLPVFLFGHSMGSFLTQQYIRVHGDEIQGAILSGSTGKIGPIVNIGIWLARREMSKRGPNWKSETLEKLTFGGYNKLFEPKRTKFDWLSRDAAEVDLYIDDPLCGSTFSTEFYYEFTRFLRDLHKVNGQPNIPRNLPIYIFSGDKDPVSNSGKGIVQLVNWYRSMGLAQVTYKLYPDGRHEMINEVNRDEVMSDILSWLDANLAPSHQRLT